MCTHHQSDFLSITIHLSGASYINLSFLVFAQRYRRFSSSFEVSLHSLFIPKMSTFHHLNPLSPSVFSLLRLLTDWTSGTEGSRKEIRGKREEDGEPALCETAFWFKAMTLVSDVDKIANLRRAWQLYSSLSVCWCVQHVLTASSSHTAAGAQIFKLWRFPFPSRINFSAIYCDTKQYILC